jgi:hypothetical protein
MWICAYNDWYVPTLSRCMRNLIIYYYLAASSQLGPISRKVTLAFHSLFSAVFVFVYSTFRNSADIIYSTGIVYIDEVDKIARKSSSTTESSRDVGGEGVQQALLRMMEGSVVTVQGKPASLDPPTPAGRGRGMPATAQRKSPRNLWNKC